MSQELGVLNTPTHSSRFHPKFLSLDETLLMSSSWVYSEDVAMELVPGADPGGRVDRVASHPPSPVLLCNVV